MPRQVHATHQTRRQEMDELAADDAAAATSDQVTAVDAADWLDEIDTVLEANSWVGCYLQRGGE